MNISKLTGTQLAEYHNKLVAMINNLNPSGKLAPVKKFRDLATAKKRVAERETQLAMLRAKAKAYQKKQAGGSPKTRRGRGQRLEFDVSLPIVEPKKGTIKAQALQLARKGCTPDQLVSLIEKHYEKSDKVMKCTAKYRGHQIIRLLANQNGFGFIKKGDKIHAIEA